MFGVVQRLDTHPVAHGKQLFAQAIENQDGELAAQLFEATHAMAAVQVHGDLAVGRGLEAATVAFQLGADALIVIELAVDHHHQVAFVGNDRLGAVTQADQAQAYVTKGRLALGVEPLAGAVRAAMMDGTQGGIEHVRVERTRLFGKDANVSTHDNYSIEFVVISSTLVSNGGDRFVHHLQLGQHHFGVYADGAEDLGHGRVVRFAGLGKLSR